MPELMNTRRCSIALSDGALDAAVESDVEGAPRLDAYTLEGATPRGAVLVVPGGGYQRLMLEKEGTRIAERVLREGWHAFVLHYRVEPHRFPAPLLDAQRAMRMVRERADEWSVIPERVAACGFSAGAHLAGSLGVLGEGADGASRPSALVLAYPVISASLRWEEGGSLSNLLGADADAASRDRVSLERHVGPDTPPTFLWHTAADAVVPVENSLLFASACARHGVPFELHVYPDGVHGMGLADREPRMDPHVATWASLACEWLRRLGW